MVTVRLDAPSDSFCTNPDRGHWGFNCLPLDTNLQCLRMPNIWQIFCHSCSNCRSVTVGSTIELHTQTWRSLIPHATVGWSPSVCHELILMTNRCKAKHWMRSFWVTARTAGFGTSTKESTVWSTTSFASARSVHPSDWMTSMTNVLYMNSQKSFSRAMSPENRIPSSSTWVRMKSITCKSSASLSMSMAKTASGQTIIMECRSPSMLARWLHRIPRLWSTMVTTSWTVIPWSLLSTYGPWTVRTIINSESVLLTANASDAMTSA